MLVWVMGFACLVTSTEAQTCQANKELPGDPCGVLTSSTTGLLSMMMFKSSGMEEMYVLYDTGTLSIGKMALKQTPDAGCSSAFTVHMQCKTGTCSSSGSAACSYTASCTGIFHKFGGLHATSALGRAFVYLIDHVSAAHTHRAHTPSTGRCVTALALPAYSLYPSPPPDVPPAIHAGSNCDGGDEVHRYGAHADALLSIAAAVRRRHVPQRPEQAEPSQVSLQER